MQRPEELEKPTKKSNVFQVVILVLFIVGLVVFLMFMSLMDTLKDLH